MGFEESTVETFSVSARGAELDEPGRLREQVSSPCDQPPRETSQFAARRKTFTQSGWWCRPISSLVRGSASSTAYSPSSSPWCGAVTGGRRQRWSHVFIRVPNRNTVCDRDERNVEPASPSLNRLDLVASIGAYDTG